MTLVDSLDLILMLYLYSGFPEKGWAVFEPNAQAGQNATLDLDAKGRQLRRNAMSGLSIVLTLMSILVAFRSAHPSSF
jgi:nickel/cobalt transporter (NiCoT) family protein